MLCVISDNLGLSFKCICDKRKNPADKFEVLSGLDKFQYLIFSSAFFVVIAIKVYTRVGTDAMTKYVFLGSVRRSHRFLLLYLVLGIINF